MVGGFLGGLKQPSGRPSERPASPRTLLDEQFRNDGESSLRFLYPIVYETPHDARIGVGLPWLLIDTWNLTSLSKDLIERLSKANF